MKQILQYLLILTSCSVVWSQTNTESDLLEADAMSLEEEAVAVPEPGEPEPKPESVETASTHIYSDTVELDIKSRSAVYRGNVRLDDPRIQLTCEQLSAEVPEEGGRVDRVVAETNVVILLFDDEGNTNRAYADKAVYSCTVSDSLTNEVVELSGDPQPRIERPEGTLYGDTIVWDRAGNRIRATNQRMIYRADSKVLTNMMPQAASGEAAVEETIPDESVAPDDAPPPVSEAMSNE